MKAENWDASVLVRPGINSKLRKAGKEGINSKKYEPKTDNFKKAEVPNNQMNKVFKAPFPKEMIAKDKEPKEEVALDCNELQDLWNAKIPENLLFEKKKKVMIEEKIQKKETPEEEVTLNWSVQNLWNAKLPEDQLSKKKKKKVLKKETPEKEVTLDRDEFQDL